MAEAWKGERRGRAEASGSRAGPADLREGKAWVIRRRQLAEVDFLRRLGPTGGHGQIQGPGRGSEESQRPGGRRANRLVGKTGLHWA